MEAMWIRIEGENLHQVFTLCRDVTVDGNSVIADCDEDAIKKIFASSSNIILRYPP